MWEAEVKLNLWSHMQMYMCMMMVIWHYFFFWVCGVHVNCVRCGMVMIRHPCTRCSELGLIWLRGGQSAQPWQRRHPIILSNFENIITPYSTHALPYTLILFKNNNRSLFFSFCQWIWAPNKRMQILWWLNKMNNSFYQFKQSL